MNAVVLADGFARGGPRGGAGGAGGVLAGGRATRRGCRRCGAACWDRLRGRYSLDGSPGYLMLEGLARLVSPYELNPLGLNPLRDILVAQVDFERVNAPGAIAVHVDGDQRAHRAAAGLLGAARSPRTR